VVVSRSGSASSAGTGDALTGGLPRPGSGRDRVGVIRPVRSIPLGAAARTWPCLPHGRRRCARGPRPPAWSLGPRAACLSAARPFCPSFE
jgi:hypothetical protein